MESISTMDSISVKHIEKGKHQVLIVLVLGIMTFLSSLIALGLGSSESLDMAKVWKIVLFDIYDFFMNLDIVLENLWHNLSGCFSSSCNNRSIMYGIDREGTALQNFMIYDCLSFWVLRIEPVIQSVWHTIWIIFVFVARVTFSIVYI